MRVYRSCETCRHLARRETDMTWFDSDGFQKVPRTSYVCLMGRVPGMGPGGQPDCHLWEGSE